MMTPNGKQKLKTLLVKSEQYRQFPYCDTTGHLTVGIGRNLTTRGISVVEALSLLDDDITYFISKLSAHLPCFDRIDENRQIVLVDMCFNLGLNGLLKFKNMIAALNKKNYSLAADEIINSKAAQQTGDRYHVLASIMRTGEI